MDYYFAVSCENKPILPLSVSSHLDTLQSTAETEWRLKSGAIAILFFFKMICKSFSACYLIITMKCLTIKSSVDTGDGLDRYVGCLERLTKQASMRLTYSLSALPIPLHQL